MGRLTQMVEYLNVEDHPSADSIKLKYTHLTIDDISKQVRKDHRRIIKKLEK